MCVHICFSEICHFRPMTQPNPTQPMGQPNPWTTPGGHLRVDEWQCDHVSCQQITTVATIHSHQLQRYTTNSPAVASRHVYYYYYFIIIIIINEKN